MSKSRPKSGEVGESHEVVIETGEEDAGGGGGGGKYLWDDGNEEKHTTSNISQDCADSAEWRTISSSLTSSWVALGNGVPRVKDCDQVDYAKSII